MITPCRVLGWQRFPHRTATPTLAAPCLVVELPAGLEIGEDVRLAGARCRVVERRDRLVGLRGADLMIVHVAGATAELEPHHDIRRALHWAQAERVTRFVLRAPPNASTASGLEIVAVYLGRPVWLYASRTVHSGTDTEIVSTTDPALRAFPDGAELEHSHPEPARAA